MDDAGLLDEDRHLRAYLAELGPDALREFYTVLIGRRPTGLSFNARPSRGPILPN